MPYLIEFPTQDGQSIVVEMDDEQLTPGFAPAAVSPGEVAAKATQSFEAAIDKLVPALQAIAERMKRLEPDEVQVGLGVKLTSEAGVIVARAAGEANFSVSLKWTRQGTG